MLFYEVGSIGENTIAFRYQVLSDQVQQSQFIATSGVFLFWATVGLMIHYILSGFIKATADAKEIKATLGYVHVKKSDVYRALIARSAIRVTAAVLFIMALSAFKQFALPYALAAVASINTLTLQSGVYAIVAVSVLMMSFYILTVLLRWVLLRPRLIGNVILEPDMH